MSSFRVSRHYVLAAGGTGGHMIPAHALAEELTARGHRVALITDDRGARIPGLFEGTQVHILPAGRLAGGPIGWLKAARAILTGRAMASRLYETFRPSAVIGFGGYPALPALLAARSQPAGPPASRPAGRTWTCTPSNRPGMRAPRSSVTRATRCPRRISSSARA